MNEQERLLREAPIRYFNQSDSMKCPSFIVWPNHYRLDGTCRHDEPICEEDGCTNLKFEEEIFCKIHLEDY